MSLTHAGTVSSCVSDETDTVGFVAFDGEMTKLTKHTFSRSHSTYGKPERTLYNCWFKFFFNTTIENLT